MINVSEQMLNIFYTVKENVKMTSEISIRERGGFTTSVNVSMSGILKKIEIF